MTLRLKDIGACLLGVVGIAGMVVIFMGVC